MELNDVLKYYYQRFKALKAGYEDTMRALGVMPDYNEAMAAHNEVLTGMKFMNGLNAGYRHYVEYYEHRLEYKPIRNPFSTPRKQKHFTKSRKAKAQCANS